MNTSKEQFDFSIRRATREDVPEIVRLLADDPLGSKREKYQNCDGQVFQHTKLSLLLVLFSKCFSNSNGLR
jgi:hypothetical protein